MPPVLLIASELPRGTGGSQNPWYSFSLFVAGFLLVADHHTERAVHRTWNPLLLTAAVTMTTVLVIQRSGAADDWANNSLPDAAFSVLEVVNTWVWVLALLGAGRALLNLDSPVLRYTSEASFPAYLMHQTVIVGIAYVVVGWTWGSGRSSWS
jgi:Acyltransferase family.